MVSYMREEMDESNFRELNTDGSLLAALTPIDDRMPEIAKMIGYGELTNDVIIEYGNVEQEEKMVEQDLIDQLSEKLGNTYVSLKIEGCKVLPQDLYHMTPMDIASALGK